MDESRVSEAAELHETGMEDAKRGEDCKGLESQKSRKPRKSEVRLKSWTPRCGAKLPDERIRRGHRIIDGRSAFKLSTGAAAQSFAYSDTHDCTGEIVPESGKHRAREGVCDRARECQLPPRRRQEEKLKASSGDGFARRDGQDLEHHHGECVQSLHGHDDTDSLKTLVMMAVLLKTVCW